jgi:hypothetical protein
MKAYYVSFAVRTGLLKYYLDKFRLQRVKFSIYRIPSLFHTTLRLKYRPIILELYLFIYVGLKLNLLPGDKHKLGMLKNKELRICGLKKIKRHENLENRIMRSFTGKTNSLHGTDF